ncbi:Glycosyltransferase Family 20 protein [Gigaspora rosea]|uniref:Glycosyltransferase Family 20 protein n=1 Tax=Gigaspora rosea TaxID=44941 RepID=A0A397VH19_9GLOM|nr:Glycosyltransferase Family 20 protein [Gigaspora rosea]
MNLLLYQYISCQQENNGVQVLSELAGTAQYLDINLDKQFELAGIGLSAKHGCFYKHPKCLQMDKKALFINDYKKRTPSASIEEKEIGIIWHYHSSSEFGKFGLWQTLHLQANLTTIALA